MSKKNNPKKQVNGKTRKDKYNLITKSDLNRKDIKDLIIKLKPDIRKLSEYDKKR